MAVSGVPAYSISSKGRKLYLTVFATREAGKPLRRRLRADEIPPQPKPPNAVFRFLRDIYRWMQYNCSTSY